MRYKQPKYNFKNKLFVTFFVSYFLMMLITVVIGSISYFITVKTVSDSLEDYNKAMLQQTKTILDEKLMSVERLALETAFNAIVVKTAYSASVSDNESLYNISRLVDTLKSSKNANDFVKSIYIFFSNSDTVISNEGKFNPDFFYSEEVPFENISLEQWRSFFKEESYRGYRPVEKINYSVYSEDVLTYEQPLSSYKLNKSLGSVVILIDKKVIDGFLENVNLHNNGAVFMVDDKNKIIMKFGNAQLAEYLNLKNIIDGSQLYTDSKFGKLIISLEQSKDNKIKYISVVPVSSYYQKASFVKNAIIIITITQMLLGLLLAFVLTNRSYRPIKKVSEMVRQLVGQNSEGPDEIVDHFSFIEQVTASTIRENVIIKEKINRLQPMLKTDLLNQLLKGTGSMEEIDGNLQSLGIIFKGNHFAVMKISIDDCSAFIKNSTLQETALVRLVISNILAELGQKDFPTWAMDYDNDHMIILLNICQRSDGNNSGQDTVSDRLNTLNPEIPLHQGNDSYDWIIRVAEEGRKFIAERFSIFISVGISSIHEGVHEISKCLSEAEDALSYKIIKGNGSIISYREIENVKGNYVYPMQTELHLINCIKTGDSAEVENILSKVFVENFGSINQSLSMARCLFFDIISTAIKVMDELNIAPKGIFNEDFAPLERLVKCKSLDEMYETLKDIYKTLCIYINKNKKSHNMELKNKILEYLQENYHNNGLSLVSVSDNLGLNPTYLSVFFKEQAGETFINYLGRLRIEKSKELLKNTDLSMQEISEKIGYANGNVFIRTFKRFEGCTPGKYRDI